MPTSSRVILLEAERFERELFSYLIGELRSLRAAVPVEDLAGVLHAARETEIFSLVDTQEMREIFHGMDAVLVRGVEAGAKLAAKQLGRIATLDAARPRIKRWVETHAAELVKQTVGTSKNAVRTIVKAGINAGRHPRRLAEDVRAVVGLTDQQAAAVARRRAYLLSGDASWQPGQAIDPLSDRPRSWPAQIKMTPARANELADQYAEQQLKLRASTIARSESLTAVNTGRAELWQQLREDGAISSQQLQEWDAVADAARCSRCGAMHRQRRAIGEEFEADDGSKLIAPPLHVQCRCVVNLVSA